MTAKTTYKRLGDYIQLVDVRNKDLKVEKLLGLSIEKCFIPSIANITGTDMSTYKIVKPKQFAYGPVTSRNGDKITIALFNGEEKVIISQAYQVFEITDEEQLCPDYLMMWFRRPEFDRYARFKSHGSAREIFDWATMCDVMVPIPSIEKQRKIVSEYQALTKRIEINNQLITKLENTAKTIYRNMFVDGIDKENLPDGWRMDKIENVCKVSIGRTPPRQEEYWFSTAKGVKWISIKDLSYGNVFISETEERLTNEAVEKFKVPKIPKDTVVLSFKMTVGRVAITTETMLSNEAIASFLLNSENVSKEYLYEYFKNYDYKKMGSTSSIVTSINSRMIKDMDFVVPSINVINLFTDKCVSLLDYIKNIESENRLLTKMLSVMMA